ncbi:MAG: DUF1559 domain-containing protein [Fuerstiella sp.]
MRYLLFLCLLMSNMSASARAQPNRDSGVLRYVTEDYLAGAVIRPARVLESDVVAQIIKAADGNSLLDEAMKELKSGLGLDPRDIEEVAILLDRKTIFSMARIADPDADETEEPPIDPIQLKNQLKQIALAMHNHHDAYNAFPDNDGRDNENKGNLSWRVHVLQMMDPRLYRQFHLNEPWDSEHNKTLIEKMPDVYRTPGVKQNGETSVHGIVGKNTIFSGDGPVSIRQITDGTSNTIMTVMAGADKADIWTKPGGISFKQGPPAETLGAIGTSVLMGRGDGSVAWFPADMKAETFRRLVVYNDHEVIEDIDTRTPLTERLPTWIVRSRTPLDRAAIFAAIKPMGEGVEGSTGGTLSYAFGNYVLAFPDAQTLVAAPEDLLPRVLKSQEPRGNLGVELQKLAADNDVAISADLTTLTPIRNLFAGNLPFAGVIQGIDVLNLTVDISGKGPYLHDIHAVMQTDVAAAQLSALLTGLVQMLKVQIRNVANTPDSPIPAGAAIALEKLYDHVDVMVEGNTVYYRMNKPKDFDSFLEQLKPAFTELSKAATARRNVNRQRRRTLDLRQIAIAFHNYHDVYNAFPRYNGDANPNPDNARLGLSWRVHLLPFLGESELYQEFDLDEPWNSETNKALIEQMPNVFSTPGVAEAGQTSIHVFIGDDALFGDGQKPTRMRDITDGTSNTLLAVQAGPDTAEVWTKPGGLKFTGKNSRQLLGKIGETFIGLLADGSIRHLSNMIDEGLLNNLIQHQDGHVVGEF